MVILKNCWSEPIEVTELHEVVCRARDVCSCTVKPGLSRDNKPQSRRLPRAFRLDGKAESGPLHPSALKLPQVIEGLRVGRFTYTDAGEVTEDKE